ncbi:hypothetical protein GGQ58_004969 [Paracoccus denitrificans]|jgi:hypothetical protein|nr:hypothetical protein [Paracoccus denitrificans]
MAPERSGLSGASRRPSTWINSTGAPVRPDSHAAWSQTLAE